MDTWDNADLQVYGVSLKFILSLKFIRCKSDFLSFICLDNIIIDETVF